MGNKMLFEAKNISKKYPGTQALKDVSLEIFEGEILGLVGENGAGKTTLLKLINGIEDLTSGEMLMNGKAYCPRNPREANAMGVGMVFQELSVIKNLTVGQNIFFGKEKEFKRFGLIMWKKLYREAKEILENGDIKNIKPEKKTGDLSFAQRQLVEIAKVCNAARKNKNNTSLILLDEPTSVLEEKERKQLFNEMMKLKEEKNSVVFISHRLDEVLEICDRIYVFKDGRKVSEMLVEDANEQIIYEKMVGRKETHEYYRVNKMADAGDEIVLSLKNLGVKGSFKNVTFDLHKGEVIGIAGVIGSGKEELCLVISGFKKSDSGEIIINDKAEKFSSPHDALKKGILSIPKERREEGIIDGLPIFENVSLSNLNKARRKGFVSKKKQLEITNEWVDKLQIKCSEPEENVNQLSGGNAQKVVFSRVLSSKANILVLNHPTRGVDVGAKEEIYGIIRDVTARGISVILVADTLAECIGLSNRVFTMKDGMITGEFKASKGKKPEEIELIKFMM